MGHRFCIPLQYSKGTRNTSLQAPSGLEICSCANVQAAASTTRYGYKQRAPQSNGTQANNHTNVPAEQVTAVRTKPPPYIPDTLSRPLAPWSEIWYEGHTHAKGRSRPHAARENSTATKHTHIKLVSTTRATGMPTRALAQATQGMAKEQERQSTGAKQPRGMAVHAAARTTRYATREFHPLSECLFFFH